MEPPAGVAKLGRPWPGHRYLDSPVPVANLPGTVPTGKPRIPGAFLSAPLVLPWCSRKRWRPRDCPGKPAQAAGSLCGSSESQGPDIRCLALGTTAASLETRARVPPDIPQLGWLARRGFPTLCRGARSPAPDICCLTWTSPEPLPKIAGGPLDFLRWLSLLLYCRSKVLATEWLGHRILNSSVVAAVCPDPAFPLHARRPRSAPILAFTLLSWWPQPGPAPLSHFYRRLSGMCLPHFFICCLFWLPQFVVVLAATEASECGSKSKRCVSRSENASNSNIPPQVLGAPSKTNAGRENIPPFDN